MTDTDLDNRRRAARKIVARPLTFVVDSDRSQIANNAFAVDLSEFGARIRPGIDLLPGQRITVIPKEGPAHAIPSQVIWVGEAGSGREGEAGIAFVKPIHLDF
jgi:hypothetical protein